MATQLDPKVVALAQAIRQTESGGNFQAVGKSGEYGAYQFTPDTWNNLSQKYLGQKVDLKSATPEQQNEVAYKQIADWKNSGKNVGQIASMWNAGEGEPDAYTGKFSNGKPSIGVNKFGVKFSVPDYAKSVATAYQTLKQGGNVGADPNNPSSTANVSQAMPQSTTNPNTGVLGTNPTDSLYGKIINNSVTRGIENIFPGKRVGEAIGTLGGYIASPNKSQYDTSAPSPLQVGADVAQGALMVGAGMPEGAATSVFGKTIPAITQPASALGRIGLNAAIGGGFGLTGAVAAGSTNLGDIAKQTAFGTALGGVAGTVGEAVTKLADSVPKRIVSNLLPQLKNPGTIDYAINNLKLGSVDSMIETSNKALNSYDSQINAILQHPDIADVVIPGEQVINDTLSKFPNSEYTPESIVSKIKSQVPAAAKLVTQLQDSGLSLDETNTLRQAIDRVTYKSAIDSPEVKAGKELAAEFANVLRNYVKTAAPETASIFSDYSKEINLNKALQKLLLKESRKGAISFRELLGALGGLGVFGPVGAVGTLAGEKVLASPAVKVGLAKTLDAVAPAIKGVATIGKAAGAVSGKIPVIGKTQQNTTQ